MPLETEQFLQIAPHSLAVVLSHTDASERALATDQKLLGHRVGYEIFADFKAENMQHFWNKRVTAAIADTFFLGWIDEHVLLIQGKEEHLGALREGWARRALRPPQGFAIKHLVSFSAGGAFSTYYSCRAASLLNNSTGDVGAVWHQAGARWISDWCEFNRESRHFFLPSSHPPDMLGKIHHILPSRSVKNQKRIQEYPYMSLKI
ncbi:uncharacterized protein LOC115079943 [Rhinatrema bivittatum]|uniref:uncharacterized protein LOC115079943 n=1 Tax=Rhinatrema bivittatum TaxID=194408 RepID=UPI00112C89B7|nr:uncharacterized protein LOC115079943 [Rhinatrema bivittatum]